MFPSFASAAPLIRVVDPLAAFLGAAAEGVIEYRYEDAVRLAGHGCPTVASSFLMTRLALRKLYGNALPVRGEIRVDLAGAPDAGVTGVQAAIASLVTGATTNTGFRGLGGRFNRRNTLFFHQALPPGGLRFVRLDTGQDVVVSADLSRVPGDPRLAELLPKCLDGAADATEQSLFRDLWQDRVRRLLIDHADDPAVFHLAEA